MDDHASEDPDIDLDASLGVLANGTRLRIIQVLAEADEIGRVGGLSYAELKEQVGVADNGRFNYHLGKLQEAFVVKREGLYYPRFVAIHIYRTLHSGAFEDRFEIEPFGTGTNCTCCGEELRATYTSNQIFHVLCESCNTTFLAEFFPSRGVRSRSTEECLAAVSRKMRHSISLTARGVCEWCGSSPDMDLRRDDELVDHGHDSSPSLYAFYACGGCGGYVYSTVGKAVLTRSSVISFFEDHGVDLWEVPVWDLEFAVTDRYTTVRSEDPWRIELVIPVEDEELALELDGDLNIVESERRAVSPR